MLAESKAMKAGLSAGAIAGIAVATTLIVALPGGVAGCVSRHGKGQTNKSQHKKTQQLQGALPVRSHQTLESTRLVSDSYSCSHDTCN